MADIWMRIRRQIQERGPGAQFEPTWESEPD
jgi:hypothetical protein